MMGFVFTEHCPNTFPTASGTSGTSGPPFVARQVGAVIVAPFEPHFVSDQDKRARLNQLSIPDLTLLLSGHNTPINIPEMAPDGLKASLIELVLKRANEAAFKTMGDMFQVMDMDAGVAFNHIVNRPSKSVRLLDVVLIIAPGHGKQVLRFVDQLANITHAKGVIIEPPPRNKAVQRVFQNMHNFQKLPIGRVRLTSADGLHAGEWAPDLRMLLFKSQ
jgi:hypothetical protein